MLIRCPGKQANLHLERPQVRPTMSGAFSRRVSKPFLYFLPQTKGDIWWPDHSYTERQGRFVLTEGPATGQPTAAPFCILFGLFLKLGIHFHSSHAFFEVCYPWIWEGEVLGWQRQAQAAWLGLESWPPRHAVAQRQPWWGPGLSGNAWQLALITLISSGGSMPWASAPVLSGPFPSLSAQSKGSWEDTPADGPINMKSSRFCSDTTLMLLPSTSKKQDSSRLRCKQYILTHVIVNTYSYRGPVWLLNRTYTKSCEYDLFVFLHRNLLYKQQEKIQVLLKKTHKILNFRLMLSNKNSLGKPMPFKLDNVQGFKMFLFTSLCEHTGRGCVISHWVGLHSEDGLGGM